MAGAGYYNQQEVEDIINLLRAVDNQRDELSLAAALRSPFSVSTTTACWSWPGPGGSGRQPAGPGAVLEGEPAAAWNGRRKSSPPCTAARGAWNCQH